MELVEGGFWGLKRGEDHGPSHPYDTGTEHVGFSPIRQTSRAPRAKRHEVVGESHEGCVAGGGGGGEGR